MPPSRIVSNIRLEASGGSASRASREGTRREAEYTAKQYLALPNGDVPLSLPIRAVSSPTSRCAPLKLAQADEPFTRRYFFVHITSSPIENK
jgi:hypothetical protein